jgi:hypothetical protein
LGSVSPFLFAPNPLLSVVLLSLSLPPNSCFGGAPPPPPSCWGARAPVFTPLSGCLSACLSCGNSGPSCLKPWFPRPDPGDHHLSLRQVNLLRHHSRDFATPIFASLVMRLILVLRISRAKCHPGDLARLRGCMTDARANSLFASSETLRIVHECRCFSQAAGRLETFSIQT